MSAAEQEALAWRDWLLRAVADDPGRAADRLQPEGERHLPEREATWLPGHHGSAPVRTGNAAAGQIQLDVYGEIADAWYWLMLEKGFADGQQHLIHRVLAVLGIDEGEGAFLACSFWLADALALSGRPDEARTLFERSLTRCNDVGLLAKHYDPHRGRLVGNFPQALSHLALVNTALLLSRRRGAGAARERGDRGAVSSSPASGGQPDGAESPPHPGAPRHLCIPGGITSRQHRPAEHLDHEQAEAAHDHERRH